MRFVAVAGFLPEHSDVGQELAAPSGTPRAAREPYALVPAVSAVSVAPSLLVCVPRVRVSARLLSDS
jgi:hypothetical protein